MGELEESAAALEAEARAAEAAALEKAARRTLERFIMAVAHKLNLTELNACVQQAHGYDFNGPVCEPNDMSAQIAESLIGGRVLSGVATATQQKKLAEAEECARKAESRIRRVVELRAELASDLRNMLNALDRLPPPADAGDE